MALMGEAIQRGEAEYAFPWQMAGVLGVVKRLPNPIFDRLARNVRR